MREVLLHLLSFETLERRQFLAIDLDLVRDIRIGSAEDLVLDGSDRILVASSQASYSATITSFGKELWLTDGTADGTRLAVDFNVGRGSSSFTPLATLDGVPLFVRSIVTSNEAELWKWDFANSRLMRIGDRSWDWIASRDREFAVLGDNLYFIAGDSEHGGELWRTDGTAEGTRLVRDLLSGSASSFADTWPITRVVPMDEALYFYANDGAGQSGLWRLSRGSDNPEFLSPALAKFGDIGVVGSIIYFSGEDAEHGLELWRSDGTVSGTWLLADVGAYNSQVRHLTNVAGTLFFVVDDGTHGDELWKSDGTTAGTSRVLDLRPGADGSAPHGLVNMRGTLYFAANDGRQNSRHPDLIGALGTIDKLLYRASATKSSVEIPIVSTTPNTVGCLEFRLEFRLSDIRECHGSLLPDC